MQIREALDDFFEKHDEVSDWKRALATAMASDLDEEMSAHVAGKFLDVMSGIEDEAGDLDDPLGLLARRVSLGGETRA